MILYYRSYYSFLIYKINFLSIKRIYLVFYIFLLKPYIIRSILPYNKELIINILYKYSNNIYKVEKVLNKR